MPSFKDTLELVLHADAAGAISELKHFSAETEQQVKNSESSLKRLSSGALKMGVAGVGVGAVLTGLGDEAKAATQQLDAAITAAGQSAEEYKGKIDDAISSDEKFGHTAHETEGALTTLVGSYGDTGEALKRMQLVEDLAAAKHIDLASAAQLVAKAHGGAGRIFKEFNIQVETNTDGTKNYEGALDKLSQKVSGQASGSMAGFTGWLKATGAAVEDDVAVFAEKFGPAILGVSTGLTALGGIGQGASAVMSRLRGSSEEAAEGASSLGSKLGTAGVVAGAALAVGALYEYGQSLNKTELSQGELTKITQMSGTQMAAVFTELAKESVGPFSGVLDDAIAKLVAMGPSGVGALQQIRDAYAATGKDTSKLDVALQGAKEAQDNLNTSTEQGSAVLGDAKQATETAAESYKRLRDVIKGTDDAQKHYRDTLKAETDPVFAIIDATDKQSDSQRNVMEKTKALTDAIRDHGRASSEAVAAQQDLDRANEDAVKSASDLVQAQLDLEDSVRKGTTSVDNARITMQGWVDQGLITQGQADQLIGRFDTLKGNVDTLNGSQIKIALDFDAQQAEATLQYLLAATGNFAAQARENTNTPGQSISGSSPVPTAPPPEAAPSTGGGSARTSSSTINITNHITSIEPRQTAHEIAQSVRAGQFLGGGRG